MEAAMFKNRYDLRKLSHQDSFGTATRKYHNNLLIKNQNPALVDLSRLQQNQRALKPIAVKSKQILAKEAEVKEK
jgi:hypothetical protein